MSERKLRWAIMVNADGFQQCVGCGKIFGDWKSDTTINHPESDCVPHTMNPAVDLIAIRQAERWRNGTLPRDCVLGTNERSQYEI